MTDSWRVIVTGAGGFIGRHIVDALCARGLYVLAIDRSFDADLSNHWYQNPLIQMIEGNLLDHSEPADYLIHAAAITTQPDESSYPAEKHLKDNLLPTLDLLEWGHSQRLRRMVFLSSDAVFSSSPMQPIDESWLPNPIGTYAVAKSATEQMVQTLKLEHQRDVVTVRLSAVYGTGEHVRPSRPRESIVLRLVRSALVDHCVQIQVDSVPRSWTFAPDIGSAICALIGAPQLQHSLYNVASQELLTEDQIARAIQSWIPDVQIQDSWDQATLPKRLGYLTHERLRNETGFQAWTPFHNGIQQVIAWQRQQLAIGH